MIILSYEIPFSLKSKILPKLRYISIKEPNRKFYSLYDKISTLLKQAWVIVRRNKGAPGVDGVTIKAFEHDLTLNLSNITIELYNKTYTPDALRRVWIPKSDGTKRGIAIANVRDRVVAKAMELIIYEIFEPHFYHKSFAYRKNLSSTDAIIEVAQTRVTDIKTHTRPYGTIAIEADLSKFFDNIPWSSMMNKLQRKIADKSFLKLLNRFIRANVIDFKVEGRKKKKTGKFYKEVRCKGLPQGAPLSPTLSNIYLTDFDLTMNNYINESVGLPVGILNYVRYADDFIIIFKKGTSRIHPKMILNSIEKMLKDEGVTLNRSKTNITDLEGDPGNTGWEFLGYCILYFPHPWDIVLSELPYIRIKEKKRNEFKKKIRIITRRHRSATREIIIKELNQLVKGHLNYFAGCYSFSELGFLKALIMQRCRFWKAGGLKKNATMNRRGNTKRSWYKAGLVDAWTYGTGRLKDFEDYLNVRTGFRKDFTRVSASKRYDGRYLSGCKTNGG